MLRELNRRPGARSPRRVIRILCEGKKTEPNYFSSMRHELRLSTLDIQVLRRQGAPIAIVRRACELAGDLDRLVDHMWCVFDAEGANKTPGLDEAKGIAEANRVNLAVSNPAFEYWLFLHYECSDTLLADASQAIDRLKKHLPNYEKGYDVFNEVWGKTRLALGNARTLRKNAVDPWESWPNPSTTIDTLVSQILRQKAEESRERT